MRQRLHCVTACCRMRWVTFTGVWWRAWESWEGREIQGDRVWGDGMWCDTGYLMRCDTGCLMRGDTGCLMTRDVS